VSDRLDVRHHHLADRPDRAGYLGTALEAPQPRRLRFGRSQRSRNSKRSTEQKLGRSRLIAFVTTVIVSADILRAVGHGAFNFHPGPPDYPGWAPAHFALYDQAQVFGVTFHAMQALVDSGPILDADLSRPE
jgi:methionyl-tRNA formyltransferase